LLNYVIEYFVTSIKFSFVLVRSKANPIYASRNFASVKDNLMNVIKNLTSEKDNSASANRDFTSANGGLLIAISNVINVNSNFTNEVSDICGDVAGLSANGADHTSLGQRPRTATEKSQGLKARPIGAKRWRWDGLLALAPPAGEYLGRCPRLG
jgi:hypothetical protein